MSESYMTGRAGGVSPLITTSHQGAHAPRSPITNESSGGLRPPLADLQKARDHQRNLRDNYRVAQAVGPLRLHSEMLPNHWAHKGLDT